MAKPAARRGPSRSPPAAAASESVGQTFLVVSLTPERFALPAVTVEEIVRAVAIAALPGAPSVVEGVINYRGRIVPVVDPRRRFGMPLVQLHPDQHFIVAAAGRRSIALRVDRATELVTFAAEAIARAADVVPAAPHVAGVVRLADGVLVIHDLERFLSLDEGEHLDRALQRFGHSANTAVEASR